MKFRSPLQRRDRVGFSPSFPIKPCGTSKANIKLYLDYKLFSERIERPLWTITIFHIYIIFSYHKILITHFTILLTQWLASILIIDHLFITNSYLMYNLYLFSIDSLHSNICTSLYIPKSLYTLSTNSPLFHLLTGLHSSTITHSSFKRTSHSMQ